MYEAFYGFSEKPFSLTPDPRFLYLSAKHGEAFAHLEFGLKQRGGFVVVTGEVGTGKTTLCRYFLDRLDETTVSAFILYPALSATELLRSISEDLGLRPPRTSSAKELVDGLHRFLLASRAQGKNIVLVIDEAQNLSAEVLEQIRLISNLETTTEKLIQIVLIGQSELNELLAENRLRQLAQRVTARYHLRPLGREETVAYIRHRLAVAGGLRRVSFTPGALRVIHRYSQGIPRIINLVCDRALLAGFVLSRRQIDARLARRAIRELDLVGVPGRPWYRSLTFRGAVAAGVLAGALAAVPSPWLWLSPGRILPSAPAVEDLPEKIDGEIGRPGAVSDAVPSSDGLAALETPDDGQVEEFDKRLRMLSGDLSRRGSAAALLGLWGIELGGGLGALSPGESLESIAYRCGLEHTVLTTHFDQLRTLNLPVILELRPTGRQQPSYAALLRLAEEEALVAFAPTDRARVPIAVLDRFWKGRAIAFWKDFDGLSKEAGPKARLWVGRHLLRLGYLSDPGAGGPEAFRSALVEFQGAADLQRDGIAGPNTQMALYSLSGTYPMPRLVEP